MVQFNPPSLRFKFIYLTKNSYEGIAVSSVFKDSVANSELKYVMHDNVPLYLIDKYSNFLPFSHGYRDGRNLNDGTLQDDIIFSVKGDDAGLLHFSNMLFFVDMYHPEHTSMLFLSGKHAIPSVKTRLNIFLRHCASIVSNHKKNCSSVFLFTPPEQQILFYLLLGKTIKEIADKMNVSDKAIYKGRHAMVQKLLFQRNSSLYERIKRKSTERHSEYRCYEHTFFQP